MSQCSVEPEHTDSIQSFQKKATPDIYPPSDITESPNIYQSENADTWVASNCESKNLEGTEECQQNFAMKPVHPHFLRDRNSFMSLDILGSQD